jgi:hypothetical protein
MNKVPVDSAAIYQYGIDNICDSFPNLFVMYQIEHCNYLPFATRRIYYFTDVMATYDYLPIGILAIGMHISPPYINIYTLPQCITAIIPTFIMARAFKNMCRKRLIIKQPGSTTIYYKEASPSSEKYIILQYDDKALTIHK